MPFEFSNTFISGLKIIHSQVFHDERGFFFESFKASEFIKNGINERFCQDNCSYSKKGVLRGLHLQLGNSAQGKLVTVLKGRAWDVAVDLRSDSSTYLKWFGIQLEEASGNFLYIPPGFAHGFITLSDDCVFFYKCTAEYSPSSEITIKWNDPTLNIDWSIENPKVSKKDKAGITIMEYEKTKVKST